MESARIFMKSLVSVRFEDTFNPYADICPVYDSNEAPKSRAKMLQKMIDAAIQTEIDAIWIGRDLGYRGGRRTGLALTDDVHINRHAQRWGLSVERPTKGEMVAERTAAVIWDILDQVNNPVFLWNVFPFHPHESGNPFSNRTHNASERKVGEEILSLLIALLKPKRLIAIGNDAEKAACKISGGITVIKVRHPSYGGQSDFLNQMRSLYDLKYKEQMPLF